MQTYVVNKKCDWFANTADWFAEIAKEYAIGTGQCILTDCVCWYQDGELHRKNEPALIYNFGRKEWWMKGKCHREGAAAVENSDGSKVWMQNGEYHRDDGPAMHGGLITDVTWYLNGEWLSFDEWIDALFEIDPSHATMMKLTWG